MLRTLSSIVIGWGVTPLLVALYSSQGVASSASTSNHPNGINSHQYLKGLIKRLTSLLWLTTRPGTSAQPRRLFPSHITKILITSHITDILRAGISTGYGLQPEEETRQIVIGLLKMLVILPAQFVLDQVIVDVDYLRPKRLSHSARSPSRFVPQRPRLGLLQYRFQFMYKKPRRGCCRNKFFGQTELRGCVLPCLGRGMKVW